MMEDTGTKEDMGGPDDCFTLRPNATGAIVSSDVCISCENQNKLKTRGTMIWPANKHTPTNKPEDEKTEHHTDTSTIKSPVHGRASGSSAPGPSPAFLAALSSLGECTNHMLLPHSLHQIAEAYFHEDDYQWALQFLHLEMLYHEKLLSNLASMQKDWESQWKIVFDVGNGSPVEIHCTEAETMRMNSLNHICRTHQRPNCSLEQANKTNITVEQISAGDPFKIKERTDQGENEDEEEASRRAMEAEGLMESGHKTAEVGRGQQLSEEELNELIEVEETFPSSGLISILKKRSPPEEYSPVNPSPIRNSSKLKVRFSETDALLDNDEAGEDSCLFFFILCLVTVVISMGGTMLYCLLGGVYSNICTDYSHSMDFYFGLVRRWVDTLTRWFIPASP